MDYISMPNEFLGEHNYQEREYYIIRLWEFISKKGNIFNFHRKKITKKDILMNYISRPWKIFPKKEILRNYVIISYHTQIDCTNWLCGMVTKAGFSTAYLSRLLNLTKPSLTNLSLPNLTCPKPALNLTYTKPDLP